MYSSGGRSFKQLDSEAMMYLSKCGLEDNQDFRDDVSMQWIFIFNHNLKDFVAFLKMVNRHQKSIKDSKLRK